MQYLITSIYLYTLQILKIFIQTSKTLGMNILNHVLQARDWAQTTRNFFSPLTDNCPSGQETPHFLAENSFREV